MRKAGFTIPPIPYEEIEAKDKQEAVEEIAAYNSEFASKNPDTILFRKYNIDSEVLERFSLGFEPVKTDFGADTTCLFHGQESADVKEDEAVFSLPQEEGKVFARPGDVFLLGSNRLMCGDCRSRSDVSVLMDGRYADMILTDPPYNVDYQGGSQDQLKIENDSMENDTFALFLKQVFSIMFSIIKPGGSFYVFHADSEGENFRKSLRSSGFKIAQCCIWVKDSLVMGRQDYQWQHEPCLYGWKPGAAHFWNSDRKQTTVWNFDKPRANRIHPTMKPVALMAYPVCNSTKTGEVVADFFSGSGSTIMACQQVDRLCYAMEIDPKYVSASVLRFRTMFPEQPVRLIRDGVLMSADETTKLCSL